MHLDQTSEKNILNMLMDSSVINHITGSKMMVKHSSTIVAEIKQIIAPSGRMKLVRQTTGGSNVWPRKTTYQQQKNVR